MLIFGIYSHLNVLESVWLRPSWTVGLPRSDHIVSYYTTNSWIQSKFCLPTIIPHFCLHYTLFFASIRHKSNHLCCSSQFLVVDTLLLASHFDINWHYFLFITPFFFQIHFQINRYFFIFESPFCCSLDLGFHSLNFQSPHVQCASCLDSLSIVTHVLTEPTRLVESC